MTTLTETFIAECREVFNVYDDRGDGTIPAKHVSDVIYCLNIFSTQSDIGKCTQFDSPSGRISFEQLLPIIQALRKNKDTFTSLDYLEMFKIFDKDTSGRISVADCRRLFTSMGEPLSSEQFQQIIREHTSMGWVNYEHLVRDIIAD